MAKPRVFVSRIIPDAGLERIHEIADAEVWEDELPPPYDTLLEKVRGVDGLVCLLTDRIDGGLMDAAGDQLKVIGFEPVILFRDGLQYNGRWIRATRPDLMSFQTLDGRILYLKPGNTWVQLVQLPEQQDPAEEWLRVQ